LQSNKERTQGIEFSTHPKAFQDFKMGGSRAACRAILLLVAAASTHTVAVPRAPPQDPSPKTPGGQSIESLFPGLLAKVDSHDLQLQQLRVENAELRKSFSDMQRNCSKVEEEVRTVQAETASLTRVDRRRKLQETNRCTGESLQAMLQSCCAGGEGAGGHRRFLQGQGCNAIPSSCSASCAPAFVEYYEGCQGIIEALEADERSDFDTLYGECKESEQAKAVMLAGAQPAMMFKMEIVETDSEQVRVRNPHRKCDWPEETLIVPSNLTASPHLRIGAGRRGDARRLRPAGPPSAGGWPPAAAARRYGRDARRAPAAAPGGGGDRRGGRGERVPAGLLAGQPHGLRAAVQSGQRRLPALGARPRRRMPVCLIACLPGLSC
jgi:hypothetical protein